VALEAVAPGVIVPDPSLLVPVLALVLVLVLVSALALVV